MSRLGVPIRRSDPMAGELGIRASPPSDRQGNHECYLLTKSLPLCYNSIMEDGNIGKGETERTHPSERADIRKEVNSRCQLQ